ncbi:MAG: hypothetical protein JWO30_3448 [Fibrobacteres bacterium]|nr:hypothetical protein [Fibrobacterota bacterium]
MNELIKVLLEIIGGTSAFLGAVYFLSKRLIGHMFEKDLEKHKSELHFSTSIEMEKIRHQNETMITEYKEKISLLANNRFEAIKIISQKMIEVWASVEQATLILRPVRDGETDQQRSTKEITELRNKLGDLLKEFLKYEIFFPNEFSEKILDFRSKLDTFASVYGRSVIHSYDEDSYSRAYEAFCEKVRPAVDKIKELRGELRKLIGVE